MTVSVVIAVYNEAKLLPGLISALRAQTRAPDEVILIDDGSTDETPKILEAACAEDPRFQFHRQENAGPAAARNRGWRMSRSEICVFTDGDCVPDADWIEKLIVPFSDAEVGAVGGMYRTMNPDNLLARFIGAEIDWRYRNAGTSVEAHGTYNLAVRREILEQIGGFSERFRKPSGEDWDLTFKISRNHRIALVRDAIVGHYHPDEFIPYLRNQWMRGFDRVRVYLGHPNRMGGDQYTGALTKYAVLAALILTFVGALSVPTQLAPELWARTRMVFGASLAGSFAILAVFSFQAVPFLWQRHGGVVAGYSVPVRWVRCFAWGYGLLGGVWAVLKK